MYGSVAELYKWTCTHSSHTLSGVLCTGQPGPSTPIKPVFVCSREQVAIVCGWVCVRMCVRVHVRADKPEKDWTK